MCELCNEENITYSGFIRPTDEKKDYIFRSEEGWFLNVYCDCGDFTPTPINYCPMCGRKLGGHGNEGRMTDSENRAYWGTYG